MKDISDKERNDILEVLGLQEGLRIATVRTAHKKYMEAKKKLQVASDKPGPAKGKAGGKGPKYMPKGRVTEGIISEISQPLRKRYVKAATADADNKYMQGMADQSSRSVGPSRALIRDRGASLVAKAINRYGHVSKAAAKLTDHTASPPAHATGAQRMKQFGVYEKGSKKVEIYHDAKHGLYHVHQFNGGKLAAKPTKYSKPSYAEHHAKTWLGEETVEEGFLSSKIKSIKKYVTGSGKEQQARLANKLKSQLEAQPAKIAKADKAEDMINARERQGDLKQRLRAVQDPARKREETEGWFGGLGGQYLSGKVSIGNSFRGTARAMRKASRSIKGINDTLPKLDAAIDGLKKTIDARLAQKAAAQKAGPKSAQPRQVSDNMRKKHADAKAKSARKSKPY